MTIEENLQALEVMIDDLTKSYANSLVKRQNLELEQILRRNVKPPITGEITKGKIRWRGIRLCQRHNMRGFEMWVEQRGEMIGPKMIHQISINIPGLQQ